MVEMTILILISVKEHTVINPINQLIKLATISAMSKFCLLFVKMETSPLKKGIRKKAMNKRNPHKPNSTRYFKYPLSGWS
jgi:hypothetical protein